MTQLVEIDALLRRKSLIDDALEARLPGEMVEPTRVHGAMRFCTLGSGKRLRPLIATAVGELAGGDSSAVMDAACAIEFVHAASLILDDLPSMDNASERRGQPSTHVVYGEATAILAAMGLIALSFDLIARNAETCGRPESAGPAVRYLANAIGTSGIIGGQHVDLDLTDRTASIEQLESAYHQKAGALFLAAAIMPAHILGFSESQIHSLERYAACVGMALQITDDLVDATTPMEDAGKTTFTTHLGVDGAKDRVTQAVAGAVEALVEFGDRAATLEQIARLLLMRVR